MGSVGQRAAKLLAVNVGGLKKSLPSSPGPTRASRPGTVREEVSVTKFILSSFFALTEAFWDIDMDGR